MLEDRNKLSHIYDDQEFNEIHSKLNDYLKTAEIILNIIETYD